MFHKLPKISDASKAAMEEDITLEELEITMESIAMQDSAPLPSWNIIHKTDCPWCCL